MYHVFSHNVIDASVLHDVSFQCTVQRASVWNVTRRSSNRSFLLAQVVQMTFKERRWRSK